MVKGSYIIELCKFLILGFLLKGPVHNSQMFFIYWNDISYLSFIELLTDYHTTTKSVDIIIIGQIAVSPGLICLFN